jgi:SpoVK/Ycf46/Vps4 family AAA+-type ATPase
MTNRVLELLAVESISECVYNERLFDELQISNEARRLVQALSRNCTITSKSSSVQEHAKEDQQGPWSSDFVPNKGGGQIILLHGKPGVGKTTTAECIAELSHRPLLTITCGDLGTYANDIQRELERLLHLGTLWNCVLLFDEADVFLESRAHGDIARNSIISVFLRAIEYHTGLMFLTTNRIGSFDEAILSRIHAVLHLPNLTTENRREIWDTSFRKLADERSNISVDFTLMNYAYNDEILRRLNWNGREIRNAFNTMIALAEWDAQHNDKYTKEGKVLVTRHHLEEVATMSGTFKSYLEELRGMNDDDHMRCQGIRGT